MKFDIYNDIVVVEYFSDRGLTMPLQLESAKVSAFELHGHTFVRMVADTTSILKTGFYDQLFLGTHISAYSQRKKEIVRTTGSNTLKDDFVEKDRYYLLKDGIYYPVKKRSSVIRVLEDRKKEVRQFIKMNTLLFSTERDRDLQIVTRYYESLFTQ
jgi:hypothetical protein